MKRLVDLSSRAPLPTLPAAGLPLPKLMQDIQARKKELASHDAEEEQRLREEIAVRQAKEKVRIGTLGLEFKERWGISMCEKR
jgi:hypothetical protein